MLVKSADTVVTKEMFGQRTARDVLAVLTFKRDALKDFFFARSMVSANHWLRSFKNSYVSMVFKAG